MTKFYYKYLSLFFTWLFKILTKVKRVKSTKGNGLKYILSDGTIIGVFYDSYSKQHHLASYVPYSNPPRNYLCERRGNFSPSGNEDKRCSLCYSILFENSKFKSLAQFVWRQIANL